MRLVAIDRRRIVAAALAMLAAPRRTPLPFDAEAPFGDGDAAVRIADVLERELRRAAAVAAFAFDRRAGPASAAA